MTTDSETEILESAIELAEYGSDFWKEAKATLFHWYYSRGNDG
jgi:hypothetical protein